MSSNLFELKILGTLEQALIPKFKSVLEIANLSKNEIVLFCDYSSYDFPIGYIFNCFSDSSGRILFTGRIMLKKVSQELFMPYDLIPHGHKTVCKFEFLDKDIEPIIKNIKPISNWYESNNYFILK